MADREQIFFRRLIAAMAPSGTYGYNSGGDYLEDFAEKKTLYIHSYIRISIQPKADLNPS